MTPPTAAGGGRALEEQGVAASPPGCQPSASAADASSQSGIPNAVVPGDLIQITREIHPWFPCVAVVSERKGFGCQAFVFIPHNDGTPPGQAYIRLTHGDYERVGAANVVTQSIYDALPASGIEAATAVETAKTGSTGGESPVGEAETPNSSSLAAARGQ